MTRRPGFVTLYIFILVYLASRVILLTPQAWEQKSKRVIFIQKQYVSVVNNCRHKIFVEQKDLLNNIPDGFAETKQDSKQFFYKRDFQPDYIFFYSGSKIYAVPGEPDELS